MSDVSLNGPECTNSVKVPSVKAMSSEDGSITIVTLPGVKVLIAAKIVLLKDMTIGSSIDPNEHHAVGKGAIDEGKLASAYDD